MNNRLEIEGLSFSMRLAKSFLESHASPFEFETPGLDDWEGRKLKVNTK